MRQVTWTDPVESEVNGKRLVETIVTVTEDGVDVTPPDMNPVRIWNPPAYVPDPDGDMRLDIGDGETATFRHDPDEALRLIIEGLP